MSIDRTSDRPFHQQLADIIRAAIQQGELLPGAPIPSETTLGQEHGLSRIVVRQAMEALRNEGLIVTEHGRGSFVRPRRRVLYVSDAHLMKRNGQPRSTWRQEGERQGFTTRQTITVDRRYPPDEIHRRLKLSEGEAAIVRDRTIYVDDEPVQLAHSWFPTAVADGTPLADAAPIPGGVRQALEELGYELDEDLEDVAVRMPTPEEAGALHLPPGVPVFHLHRTTLTTDGRPVHADDDVLAGDCHVLSRRIRAVDS